MGLKEYIKPSLGKIILTIILAIIGYFIVMLSFGCGFSEGSGGEPDILCTTIAPILRSIFSVGFYAGSAISPYLFGPYYGSSSVLSIGIPLQILWSYILSVLIFFVIGKIKSPKTPQ